MTFLALHEHLIRREPDASKCQLFEAVSSAEALTVRRTRAVFGASGPSRRILVRLAVADDAALAVGRRRAIDGKSASLVRAGLAHPVVLAWDVCARAGRRAD